MNPPQQEFTYISNTGILTSNAHPEFQKRPELADFETAKTFQYSTKGKYLVVVKQKLVQIYHSHSRELVREIEVANVLDYSFSPLETYLTIWSRYIKPADGMSQTHNLVVVNIESGKQVLGFPQKSNESWNVQWTDDEVYCAKQIGEQVQIFDTSNLSEGSVSRIKLEGLQSFSMSPGKRPVVAVFSKGKNGSPSAAKIYDISNLSKTLTQKTLMRADSVTFYWNAIGTNVLVFVRTDVDVTGQSYYGETSLYFLSITGNFDCKVELKQNGPIHDVCWAPNSKEFIVVYGSMPARCTLFDHRALPIYELGTGPRNTVKYSPSGRFFFIGGFGNLPGDMDVWERKGFKKLTTISASNSSMCEWSPDGRYILTATLYRRLKVDNGIKIWHYSGVLTYDMEVKELYQASWRPEACNLWPEKSSSSPIPVGVSGKEVAATPKKPTGRYVPPGMRNSAAAAANFYDREAIDKDLATNLANTNTKITSRKSNSSIPGLTSKTPGKGGKKENNSKNVVSVAGNTLNIEKKIKNINKKLKQISDLKSKRDSGVELELTQISKIDSEPELIKELDSLKKIINGE